MSNMREPVLKAVADVVKDHVGKAFGVLRGQIDELREQIKAAPQPERGEKGEAGPPGIRGDIGPAGKDGVNGRDGAQGDAGINGIDGAPGKDGGHGRDGEPGPEGKQGQKGLDGAAGKDGKDGLTIKGDPGSDGKDGLNGTDGKDASAVDTKALSEDIVQKVLGLIPPPKAGVDGKDGASVDVETVKLLVLGEVNKAIDALPPPVAGRDGRDGRKGDPGLPGKDAADIDFLMGIDESQAYQKGQWARHKGGLIMAYRTTDPIKDGDLEAAGWAVMQNGIAEMHQALASDGRTLITTVVGTDGKAMPMKVKMANPQYQKAWEAAREYERGDYVTMAGSLWHSNRINKDRPGTSDAWTLAVKRGSDGKDMNGTRQ